MILPPLAKDSKVEFAVNGRGEAMLMHEGPVARSYSWAQYDPLTDSIQFITNDGSLQELGFALPRPVRAALSRTQQLTIIRVNEENVCMERILVVFSNVLH